MMVQTSQPRAIERDIVSAIIYSGDGKILLGKKHPGKGGVYLDCWHIPGGGVEEGENLKSALTREIKEETGLDIDQNEFIFIDDLGHGESEKTLKTGEKVLCKMHFNVFRTTIPCLAEETKIDKNEEFERIIWADKSEIGTLALTPPSVVLFERLGIL